MTLLDLIVSPAYAQAAGQPTPGGLFAPMLVLGAQLGFFCGVVCRLAFPDLGIEPEAFAVVGMAALLPKASATFDVVEHQTGLASRIDGVPLKDL